MCVVFPSVVSGGFPPLSNQGTPLILSCPIGREQYEEICTSILSLLLRWTFLLFQTSFSLKNKKTRLESYLNSFLLCVLLLSSLHLFGENKNLQEATGDLWQNTCSCWLGAKWTVSCSCSKRECLETRWAAVCWPDDQTLLAVCFVITF